ncbi:L-threonylcarbamoyladenylate synthase [Aureimonas altamirensis]|uniref:L-threonylcarbamoyladenylate synthase n=1 Tax=Aureimonas altamirensis TaxID=370622 RepID=UPI002036C92A|nr:L-threonylcarbamoyladenylate synthase [Aureimonas altamirensis]MCM2503165.1 L-threonylcarbamoyladenylate synthase [Aureimonas altamirensis]
MTGRILDSSEDSMAQAVACLADGGLVALPTETVYGLAADATSGRAVARIYEAKGRPSFNPLIGHVSSMEMARRFARFEPLALALAERFWPGPLTLVLPLAEGSPVHPLVTAGLPTLALRMPRGPMAEIVHRLGRPLAAPSANRSGKVSPTTARHVARSLAGRVDLILDAGPAAVGLESTILKPDNGALYLLRPGGLTVEAVTEALGVPVVSGQGEGIEAPGQMQSHYAPSGAVRLNASHVDPGEHLIAFGDEAIAGAAAAASVFNLSRGGDLAEAASNLFAALAALDRPDITRIAVAPIPERGLGLAINDRLRRAAAPR